MRKKIRKKKRNSNTREEFNLAVRYLKESHNYIYITFGVFIFLFVLGFIVPFIAPPEINNLILEQVKIWVENLLEKTQGKGFFGMWWFIFQNNTLVSLISIFSGFFFGIVPALFLFSNGFFIGIIAGIISFSTGDGFNVLLRLVPHGIFEIPAIIISFAIGIKFGTFPFKKNPKKVFKKYLINSARVFTFIILPLLLIASVIEAALIVFVG